MDNEPPDLDKNHHRSSNNKKINADKKATVQTQDEDKPNSN
jgi:hypothetical protein